MRLTRVGQELTTGIAGACLQWRTLDGVNLYLARAELLVLTGGRDSGVDALLKVLNGDRRGLSGVCEISPQVCMQRATVTEAQASAIISGWPSRARVPRRAALRVAEGTPERAQHPYPIKATVPVLLLELMQESTHRRDIVGSALLRAHVPLQRWLHAIVDQGGAAVLGAGQALAQELLQAHHPGIRIVAMRQGRASGAPSNHRRRTTFHSRSRHSGRRSADLHSAHPCQSFVSSIPSVGK